MVHIQHFQRCDKNKFSGDAFACQSFYKNKNIYINLNSRCHSPYILVYKDPLYITYLLVSVPSILTLRYMCSSVIPTNDNVISIKHIMWQTTSPDKVDNNCIQLLHQPWFHQIYPQISKTLQQTQAYLYSYKRISNNTNMTFVMLQIHHFPIDLYLQRSVFFPLVSVSHGEAHWGGFDFRFFRSQTVWAGGVAGGLS